MGTKLETEESNLSVKTKRISRAVKLKLHKVGCSNMTRKPQFLLKLLIECGGAIKIPNPLHTPAIERFSILNDAKWITSGK